MKKKIFLAILSLYKTIIIAQNPLYEWAKKLGSPANNVEAACVTTDFNGNVYTTGSFNGTADFDPSLATYNMTSFNSKDIFISKLNAQGQFVWTKQFTDNGFCEGTGISTDVNGNVYSIGNFGGPIDLDPGPGTYTFGLAPGIITDAYVSKLDSSGNFVWAKQIPGNYNKDGRSITIDISGNIYIMSVIGSSTYVSKLDPAGNFIWTKHTEGSMGSAFCKKIAVDVNGNTYVTGAYYGTVDFNPGPGVYNLTANSGNADIFAFKLDAMGNFIAAIGLGSSNTSNADGGFGITCDAGGNAFITGRFYDSIDFDPGPGTYSLTSAGGLDVFVLKLDPTFNFLWAKRVGAINDDLGWSIATDNIGKVYICGHYTHQVVDFDPGPATFNLSNYGSEDIFLLKLDQSGNFEWARAMGGYFDDYGFSVHVDNLGYIYITGFFGSHSVDFDPGPGIDSLTNNTGFATYVEKFKICTSQPNISVVSNSSLICQSQSATLTANGASTYTWSTGSNNQTIVVSPMYTTTYSLTGSDSIGCDANYSITQNVSLCTSLADQNNNHTNFIYPNPCKNEFYIMSGNTIESNTEVEIKNIFGQIIKREKLYSPNTKVDVAELTSGIYFLSILRNNKFINVHKLIKE